MSLMNLSLKNHTYFLSIVMKMSASEDFKSNIINSNVSDLKVRSAPIDLLQKPSIDSLKVQFSAPSYFHSLKENEAPPFRKPGREMRPQLLIGTVITEVDVVEIIASVENSSNDGLKGKLGEILVKKNIVANYHLPEKFFLISLLKETIDYAAQKNFNAFKLACLLTIYLTTHVYFKWYYWNSSTAVWNYFKEIMIRHTIEDSPDGQEVFEPEECYDILTHFHTIYLSNLPLVHILTFDVHRLKLSWPFKP